MAEDETPFLSPFDCAVELICDYEELLHETIEGISELSYVSVLLLIHPGIEARIPNKNTIFYEVDDEAAENLTVMASGSPEAFEMFVRICKANIFNGVPIPQAMRKRCFSLINDTAISPKKRGPVFGQAFGLFYVAWSVAEYLAKAYRLPKVRGDGMEPNSAADLVAEALNQQGISCKYVRVRDWLTAPKHREARLRALAISDMFIEHYLVSIGLVRSGKRWAINPYGQLAPIGRITQMKFECRD